ncbi:2-oxoglutarate dehydrogenase, E2 component, dihydrolipoamide succinyltransferase [Ornithinimicrobium cerasi]|uniref:2-oxoglutarate dehydrogenase, E2 component, dihydrolipoamide succinyltransferase n=1 Tax=Ornithinimicrobium cerasi TaxID=2248773 RepID=UPI000F001398|nr:2-oxoglutarate dehydrogenase, E2 component, dihydrolipoamide succinyltransferase [Ornithinimicrobium cerasi]
MSERVTMPALGESVTEGTVTRWLKSIGDTVEVDEPLVEVSTDKVDTEIPSPVSGVLQEILAEEDDTVEVGGELCVIGDGSEGSSSGGSDEGAAAEEPEEPAEDTSAQDAAEGDGADQPEQAADEAPAQQRAEDEPPSPESGASGESAGGSSDGSGGGGGGGETVTMPALGESVTEGTITRWLKAEGDTVEVDEPLVEVSTDKVDTEVPSPVAGVLTKIIAGEDETVEVGGELCVVGGEAGGSGSDGSDEGADASSTDQAPAQDSSDETGSTGESQSQAPTADDAPADASEEDLGGEQELHEAAAQESTAKEDEAPDMQEPEPAVGIGTESADNGSTSHKDSSEAQAQGTGEGQASGDAAPQGGQDVSAYVTPLVRKLAAQHGVDLNALEGTGVGGRIRKQDVLDAAKAAEAAKAAPAPSEQAASGQPASGGDQQAAGGGPAAAPAASSGSAAGGDAAAKRGTTEKMSRLRKVIATRMVESLQSSAQLTTVVEVDVTKVARLRNRTKNDFVQREGVKLSFMPFFAMAVIEALKAHPIVNASVEDDTIVYHAAEHLGVAVDTPRGLLVPVIKDAGDLNIAGLARKIADLAERTRDNKVTPDELSGGTFTLTNTGSRGALFDTPIINMPNVAILGTGAVVKRPVVVTDEDGSSTIAIRDMVYLAISYDHRVVDGADAARFLTTMKERLEEGNFEV